MKVALDQITEKCHQIENANYKNLFKIGENSATKLAAKKCFILPQPEEISRFATYLSHD